MNFRQIKHIGILGLATALGGAGVLVVPLAASAVGGAPRVHDAASELELIGAINAINAAPDEAGDVIRFTNDVPTTIALSADLPALGKGVGHAQSISIEGKAAGDGTPLVTIDGGRKWGGFQWLNPTGGTLGVSRLRIVGTGGSGIAVENQSPVDVKLKDVQVANTGLDGFRYDAAGEAITVENSTFNGNASGSGVRITNSALTPQLITLKDSEANGNSVGFQVEDPNSTFAKPGHMKTVATQLTANENTWTGVKVDARGASSAFLNDVTALRNMDYGLFLSAEFTNSLISVDGAEISGTMEGTGVRAEVRNAGSLTISGAALVNNADGGLDGSLSNGGSMELLSSVARGNGSGGNAWSAVSFGSGNSPANVLVRDVSVIDNESSGAALSFSCEVGGKATLENSTVSGNKLTEGGSGLRFDECDESKVINSTIADNQGNGLEMAGTAGAIDNSILSGNTDSDLAVIDWTDDEDDQVGILVHNSLAQTASTAGALALAAGSGNLTDGTGPVLAPLAYNGGPRFGSDGLAFQTRLPATTSPVVDSGDSARVPIALANDQRGASRIQGDRVDMGSVEVQPDIPAPTPTTLAPTPTTLAPTPTPTTLAPTPTLPPATPGSTTPTTPGSPTPTDLATPVSSSPASTPSVPTLPPADPDSSSPPSTLVPPIDGGDGPVDGPAPETDPVWEKETIPEAAPEPNPKAPLADTGVSGIAAPLTAAAVMLAGGVFVLVRGRRRAKV